MQNVQIRVICGVMGHPRSPAMSPFDRVHTTFYLTLIKDHASILYRFRGQGLKYNFQGGKMFSSLDPSSFPAPYISWAHVSIAASQVINRRLNVLRTISVLCDKYGTQLLQRRFL